ncbi:YeeE/YedE family protein [Ottowia thiooxydans]|uniref:YeeE/YedE family protein n=1 Tax=Ottowia thiooxydans TaxID=219182 RepID=UPI0006861116|nr:YeeE/YedE family protein [Ottowia thiooxydans]
MPDLASLVDRFGTGLILAVGGALIGALFGFLAFRSRFCLRAAVIEFWHAKFGEKLSVWLLAFSTAVVLVQALVALGWLDVSGARQLANRGSLSGSLIGGLLFGAGMIMTRGCASRLLVLSAGGNLRALLSGLVFAVTAQAALSGALAPLRLTLSGLWTVEGGAARDLLAVMGITPWAGLALGFLWLAVAIGFGRRVAYKPWMWLGAMGTGLSVALAWWFTYEVSQAGFDVVQVQGLTFSGPSAEWLMRVLSQPAPPIGFDFGLLPGVFAGAFLAAWRGGELKIEGFSNGRSMARYICGAIAMGFGSMLAGGCAVGAGMTGGAIFSLTAWLALLGMWVGGGLMEKLIGEPVHTTHATSQKAPMVVQVAP